MSKHPRYPDLDVELAFHPVVNDSPRRITRDQIASFNQNGYLSGLPVLSSETAARYFAFFEGPFALARKAPPYETAYHRGHEHPAYFLPEMYRLVTDPLLVGYLQDILGPNVICHVREYICKRPNDHWASTYHQDATFNALSHARSVVVWLALADVDEGNGCMRFMVGSHKRGHLPFHGENEKSPFGVIGPELYGPAASIELKAGQVAIFSDFLVHGAPSNPSPSRLRPGFTMTFCSADIVPYKDWDKMAILCCGNDRQRNWRIKPRLAGQQNN